jgi:hypothetical protein
MNQEHRERHLESREADYDDREEVMSREADYDDREEIIERRDSEFVSQAGEDGNSRHARALFSRDEADDLRRRWDSIQGRFVDDPRDAVAEADSLVSEVIDHITDQFDAERSRLEARWNEGDNVSTEDLRRTVQRYRSFFHHLLSM